jgi:hypothetical protein
MSETWHSDESRTEAGTGIDPGGYLRMDSYFECIPELEITLTLTPALSPGEREIRRPLVIDTPRVISGIRA